MFACARPCAALRFELLYWNAVRIQFPVCRDLKKKKKSLEIEPARIPGEAAGLRVTPESCGAVCNGNAEGCCERRQFAPECNRRHNVKTAGERGT